MESKKKTIGKESRPSSDSINYWKGEQTKWRGWDKMGGIGTWTEG
jgi:hypothetical protein